MSQEGDAERLAKWLPGCGLLSDVREKHERALLHMRDPDAVQPNPYEVAQIALLLRELDARDVALASAYSEIERLREAVISCRLQLASHGIREPAAVATALTTSQPDATEAEPLDTAINREGWTEQELKDEQARADEWLSEQAEAAPPNSSPPSAEDVAQWLLQGGNQYTAARILQHVDNYYNGDEQCSFVAMALDIARQAGVREGREQAARLCADWKFPMLAETIRRLSTDK